MYRLTSFSRITPLLIAIYLVTGTIIFRLFYLQVIAYSYYEHIAELEQYGYTTLPARRGEILVEDYHTGEGYTLATNTTLSMIYADPTLISDPEVVAATLAPLLYDHDEQKELDDLAYEDAYDEAMKIENVDLRNEAISKLHHKTDDELFSEYQKEMEDSLADRTRDTILIAEALDTDTQQKVRDAHIEGTELTKNGNFYAYPAKITDKSTTAEEIAALFGTDADALETTLLGKNRYVELKHKLSPEISSQIEALLKKDREDTKAANAAIKGTDEKPKDPVFLGIGMKDEYFRYYPEQTMAAQILGFVSSAGDGSYGVEGTFNEILKGKDGIFTSQVDAYGNQITVGKSVIEDAKDGADITLTIDRAIQSEVETLLLGDGTFGYSYARPDSAQAIVINPKTGAILALAQYPTFNPNSYGDVYEKTKIDIPEDKKGNIVTTGTPEEPIYWYYVQKDPDVKIQIFQDPEDNTQWYSYENLVGPEVYKNKLLQEVYEPGSVFKPLVMASAINAGEVTPNTTFNDSGPIGVDFNEITGEYDYYINTFNNQYHGLETMTQVLEHSCNTGMTFISKKLGPALFYSYLKAFGLTERTNMGLNDEALGKLAYYESWTESEMVTKAFGQGISINPLQLAQAYTAIFNNGTMMKPYIIKSVEFDDGQMEEFEPTAVRQVISADTAQKITAMMADVVESYQSMSIPDHYFSGKSGTAQTYKNGIALSGAGTTEATFVGAGPIEDPQFLVIVKMDRPRSSEWAEGTSGQVLIRIMSYLYDYYSIPPDKTTTASATGGLSAGTGTD